MPANQPKRISEEGKSGWSEVLPYMHTLKLYFELFCGWRCSLHSGLSYYSF